MNSNRILVNVGNGCYSIILYLLFQGCCATSVIKETRFGADSLVLNLVATGEDGSALRLNIVNTSSQDYEFTADIGGRFWGELVVRCSNELLVVRDRNVWEDALSDFFVAKKVLLKPGQRVSYELPIRDRFITQEEFVSSIQAKSVGDKAGAERGRIRNCKIQEIYCISFDRRHVSNVLVIRKGVTR
jgi:hypothetical protein